MRYLHTMIRISDIDQSLDFFCTKLGLKEVRRYESQEGRYTLIFLAAPEDEHAGVTDRAPLVELTYKLGSRRLCRRPQFRPPRLRGRRHLCHMPAIDGQWRDHQPPAPRRSDGLCQVSGRHLDRAAAKGRRQVEGRALGIDGQHRRLVGDIAHKALERALRQR